VLQHSMVDYTGKIRAWLEEKVVVIPIIVTIRVL
jgi:hypothetical protein